ncbi:hypothetical protein BDW75DRAFT_206967 [Aspergillus navahoensis]
MRVNNECFQYCLFGAHLLIIVHVAGTRPSYRYTDALVLVVNRDCYYYGPGAGYYSKERTTRPKPGEISTPSSISLSPGWLNLSAAPVSSLQWPAAERSRVWTIAFRNGSL